MRSFLTMATAAPGICQAFIVEVTILSTALTSKGWAAAVTARRSERDTANARMRWIVLAALAMIRCSDRTGYDRRPPAARAKALDPFGWQSPPATRLPKNRGCVAGGLCQPMGSGALGPSRRRPPVVPRPVEPFSQAHDLVDRGDDAQRTRGTAHRHFRQTI